MDNSLIFKIASKYDIKPIKIFPPQHGYRNKCYRIIDNSGNEYNMILYKNEPQIVTRIRNANRISNYLAEKGWPTRMPVSIDSKSVLSVRAKYILPQQQNTFYTCLYNYLPGQTIPWEGYTMKHIKLLGKTMSDMHCALKDIQQESLPHIIDECNKLLYEMKLYFADKGVAKAMKTKLDITINEQIFIYFAKLLKVNFIDKSQPLHMDFVRSNILFGIPKSWSSSVQDRQVRDDKTVRSNCHSGIVRSFNEEQYPESRNKASIFITLDPRLRGDDSNGCFITGILDFEKTAFGPRIFDIARTLAFLIVDCKYKTEEKVSKYFLYSGYDKRGTLKLPDLKYLNALVMFFLLHDFYKFLKYNPYENLTENDHYMRTINLLSKYRLFLNINKNDTIII